MVSIDKPRRRKLPYVVAVAFVLLVIMLVLFPGSSTPAASPAIGSKVAALEAVMVELKSQVPRCNISLLSLTCASFIHCHSYTCPSHCHFYL